MILYHTNKIRPKTLHKSLSVFLANATCNSCKKVKHFALCILVNNRISIKCKLLTIRGLFWSTKKAKSMI